MANGSNVIVTVEPEVLLFSVTAETVKPMADRYMTLTIKGIEDKAGYDMVRMARSDVRTARTTVEEERVAAKAYYLEGGKKVDAAAKKVQALIAPIEKHLVDQLQAVEAEIQRIEEQKMTDRLALRMSILREVSDRQQIVDTNLIRNMTNERFEEFVVQSKQIAEEIKAKNERIEERYHQLDAVGGLPYVIARRLIDNGLTVDTVDDSAFYDVLIEAKRLNDIEMARAEKAKQEVEQLLNDRAEFERLKAAEAERQRIANAEVARLLAIENAKLDAIRKEQEAEAARIEGERQQLADEAIAKEIAETAERMAKEKAEDEKRAIEAEEIRVAEFEKRRLALMPDRTKILEYARAIDSVVCEELSGEVDAEIVVNIRACVERLLCELRAIANEM